jgi:hypothetical protein
VAKRWSAESRATGFSLERSTFVVQPKVPPVSVMKGAIFQMREAYFVSSGDMESPMGRAEASGV